VRAYYLRVPNETLMPRDALSATLLSTRNHFETQCGSWAGFKLTKHLQTCTGARKLLALGFTKEKARVCAFNGRGAWPREVFPLRHGARVFPLLHGAGGMPGLST